MGTFLFDWSFKNVPNDYLAKAGCTKFFLMSNCNSDWQFYEHLNMKRILEDHSQDTGDGFIVYMYGGNTQD